MVNQAIHLHPFPNDTYRFTVLGYVLASVFGAFLADRVVTFLFAREIFDAMLEATLETKWVDLYPVCVSLVKTVLGFAIFATGNPIIWMIMYWLYKKYSTNNNIAT